jgi:NADH dehydrogenase
VPQRDIERGAPTEADHVIGDLIARADVEAIDTIARKIEGKDAKPFEYRDKGTMATIGRGSAVGHVFGLDISGFFAWLFWIFLHIFWLIGFRNRFVVMTEWAWSYITMQRRVRLITGERLWPSSSS